LSASRPTPWEPIAALLMVVGFYALTLPHWHEAQNWGHDTDKIFASVHLLLDHGELPGLGNGILPTELKLGSAYFYLIAALHGLAGRDLWTTWLLLATTNLVAILAGVAAMRRWFPPAVAWTMGWVLVSDPLMYAEQGFHPFWYQHYSLWLMLPVMLGCLAALRNGSLVGWYLAAGAAGLAVQYHAMLWTMLPCGALLVLLRWRKLGPLQIAGGVALFTLCALPMVGQLPVLLEPDRWTTMVTDQTDRAVAFQGTEAIVQIFGTLADRATGHVLALLLGTWALFAAAMPSKNPASDSTSDTPSQQLAWLVLAWCSAIAVVFAIVSHRLHIHYGYLLIVPLAAMISLVVARLPRHVIEAPWTALALALVFLPRAIFAPDIDYSVPLNHAWQYHQPIISTFERLSSELGASRRDVMGPKHRAHGFPCAWKGSGICPSELPPHLLDGPGMSGHVAVRLVPGEGVRFEPFEPCVDTTAADGVLTLSGACDDTPRHLWMVLSAPVDQDAAWPSDPLAPGWTTLAQLRWNRFLVVGTESATVWSPGTTKTLPLPEGFTVADAWLSIEPWHPEHLGVALTGPVSLPR
jgi:hypothetical protein